MNKSEHGAIASDHLKARKAKSREVSSRYLSPTSSSSPNRRNSTSNSSIKRENNLLDFQDNNRLKDLLDVKRHNYKSDGTKVCFRHPRQRTLGEFSCLEDDTGNTKENFRPSSSIDDDESVILPGRYSVDECALYRTSPRRNSCSLLCDSYNYESDSELSDASFASTFSASCSVRSREPGIQVPSKYLHDSRSRHKKGASKCSNNTNNRAPAEDSQKVKSFRGIKNMIERANSLARYGSSTSQWALSPGRSGSPPLSSETKGEQIPCSRLKPPPAASTLRAKGVGKLLNLGFDFFKSKKKLSSFSSSLKLDPCDIEAVHQLKLLHNRLVQWRFVNARTCAANNNVDARGKKQLLCTWGTLSKLERSVLQDRIGLQKRKLEKKLGHILLSQIKHLEAWQDIERQHLSALSMTQQCLHSVVSRLPLTEGAKVDMGLAVRTFQQGEAVTDSLRSTLTSFGSWMEGFVPLVSELAEVVAQEKLMLEECHDDLLRMTSELEMRERSLKFCYIIQYEQTVKTSSSHGHDRHCYR